jgi:DNA-binding NarL/FixJ family response regulator
MKKLRILIADDHEMVRQGLRAVLENHPGWEVCGEAADGREALARTRQLKPDVVVMDISMPQLNGLEATRQITRAHPSTHVVVLTVHDSEVLVRRVLEAGARGYVLKSDAGRDVVAAIESLAANKPFFTTAVSELLLQTFLKACETGEQPGAPEPLTPREREIVQLLAEGKSNKEAGAVLGISVRTVEAHRAHIMQKLDLQSFSELVHYAMRNGITGG